MGRPHRRGNIGNVLSRPWGWPPSFSRSWPGILGVAGGSSWEPEIHFPQSRPVPSSSSSSFVRFSSSFFRTSLGGANGFSGGGLARRPDRLLPQRLSRQHRNLDLPPGRGLVCSPSRPADFLSNACFWPSDECPRFAFDGVKIKIANPPPRPPKPRTRDPGRQSRVRPESREPDEKDDLPAKPGPSPRETPKAARRELRKGAVKPPPPPQSRPSNSPSPSSTTGPFTPCLRLTLLDPGAPTEQIDKAELSGKTPADRGKAGRVQGRRRGPGISSRPGHHDL